MVSPAAAVAASRNSTLLQTRLSPAESLAHTDQSLIGPGTALTCATRWWRSPNKPEHETPCANRRPAACAAAWIMPFMERYSVYTHTRVLNLVITHTAAVPTMVCTGSVWNERGSH